MSCDISVKEAEHLMWLGGGGGTEGGKTQDSRRKQKDQTTCSGDSKHSAVTGDFQEIKDKKGVQNLQMQKKKTQNKKYRRIMLSVYTSLHSSPRL